MNHGAVGLVGLELQTDMRYRETSPEKTSSLSGGNRCGPGIELVTRFKPFGEAPLSGAFVNSRACSHQLLICHVWPGAGEKPCPRAAGVTWPVASPP